MEDKPHICTCGDCKAADFDDRCKFELLIREIVSDEAVHDAPEAAYFAVCEWQEKAEALLFGRQP